MQANNIVYMASVRELLMELDKLRSDILAGEIEGWGGSVKFTDGREVTYLGGTFKGDSSERAKAMLRVSAVRVLHEDETIPPTLPRKRRTH
jgi:hypothetical protein